MSRTEEERQANAELIAAAGTAATALAEAGYDAVEVFRALPEIMKAIIHESVTIYSVGQSERRKICISGDEQALEVVHRFLVDTF